MDFLPKEIEDIIINYKSQLEHTSKNNIVLNEMEKNKYWCRMCWDLCHKHIIPILKKCDCCEEPICIDCEFTFTDGNNGDECDDCFFHGLIYRSLIGIINRKFTDKEHNYIETDAEREEGHVDTIKRYFDECLSVSRLGCDPGIDIPG